MKKYIRIAFADIQTKAPDCPGVYEIHTQTGTALKVGISSNLKRRLIQHGESRQKYLGERRRFLNEQCYIIFQVTSSRAEARELEKELEATGRFCFVGRVAPG